MANTRKCASVRIRHRSYCPSSRSVGRDPRVIIIHRWVNNIMVLWKQQGLHWLSTWEYGLKNTGKNPASLSTWALVKPQLKHWVCLQVPEAHSPAGDRRNPTNAFRAQETWAEIRHTAPGTGKRWDAMQVLQCMRSLEIKCLNAHGRQDKN